MNNNYGSPVFGDIRIPLITIWICMSIQPAAAQDPERGSVREFRTQDERLEAGNRRQIGESLYLTTLAELEWDRERRTSQDATESGTETGSALVLQAGLTAAMTDQVQAELEAEYDSEDDELIVDEAILAVERDPFELEVGKDTLGFGEYFSRFTTGPLLEFGETTDSLFALSYSHPAGMEMSLSAYDGRAELDNDNSSSIDYVLAGQLEPADPLSLGISYITDLADSDERLLADSGRPYTRKVPAISGYALWSGRAYDATFEYVTALKEFNGLDPDFDKPSAWNAELGLFIMEDVDMSFRIEGGNELEEAPDLRTGAAVTWRFHQDAMLTVETLYGRFDNDSAARDNGSIESNSITAVQILVAF